MDMRLYQERKPQAFMKPILSCAAGLLTVDSRVVLGGHANMYSLVMNDYLNCCAGKRAHA